MSRSRHSTARFPALVAAVVLLLHAFSFGLSTGAMAAPAGLDAFGNPLCTTDRHGDPTNQPERTDQPGHSAGAQCCAFACSASSGALDAAPSSTLQAVLTGELIGGLALLARTVDPRIEDHSPANPRAPPASV